MEGLQEQEDNRSDGTGGDKMEELEEHQLEEGTAGRDHMERAVDHLLSPIPREEDDEQVPLRVGNDRRDSTNMNYLDRQKYMVSLVKWVKKNYEAETLSEMKKANVPKPKVTFCNKKTLN